MVGLSKIHLNLRLISGVLLLLSFASSGAAAPTKKAPIKWPTSIDWVSFEAGQQQAALTQKPMVVLVYANWCTQCDALAKSMEDAGFVTLTKSFIMVLADHDDKSQGVHVYTPKLTYVPRLLFMKPEGAFWSEMVSGNERYPYFYQSSSLEKLMENMKQSLKAHRQVK